MNLGHFGSGNRSGNGSLESDVIIGDTYFHEVFLEIFSFFARLADFAHQFGPIGYAGGSVLPEPRVRSDRKQSIPATIATSIWSAAD